MKCIGNNFWEFGADPNNQDVRSEIEMSSVWSSSFREEDFC